MSKESAQWIGNSLYAIMITFVLSFTLFRGDLNNYSPNIPWTSVNFWLSVVLFSYYLLDWLSFNAILDYDPKAEHLQVLCTIIFILTLGWLLIFASYLNDTIVGFYAIVAFLYLLLTSALSCVNLWVAHRDRKAKKADILLTIIESVLRLVIVSFILIYACEEIQNRPVKLRWVLLIAFSLILFVKYIRYKFLLLRWVREVKNQEKKEYEKQKKRLFRHNLLLCRLVRDIKQREEKEEGKATKNE